MPSVRQSKITQVDFGSGETTRGKLVSCRRFCGFEVIDSSSTVWRAGSPPHIYVAHAGRYAKFWLDPVELANNRGSRGHELTEIRQIVIEHQSFLLEKWHEHFSR